MVVLLHRDVVSLPELVERQRAALVVSELLDLELAATEQLGPLRAEVVVLERLGLVAQETAERELVRDRAIHRRPLALGGDAELVLDHRHAQAAAIVCYNPICRINAVPAHEVKHMTAKTPAADIAHCVELLRQGKKVNEIVRITGVSRSVCYRAARANGIDTSRKPRHESIDAEKVIAMFHAGRGSAGIGKEFGTTGAVINRLLADHGIKPRSRSEQQQARMDNASPEEVARLTRKAHAASRGRVKSEDEIRKAAASRFASQSSRSSYLEETFDELMRERGYHGIRQFAIDKYNADFLFGNVAVEIFGGIWHWNGLHAARAEERIKTILDHGFHLIIIAARSQGVSPETADHTVALLDELGRDESAIRHYRMIASNGQLAIAQCSDDDHFTIEWPFRNVRDRTTGRYVAVRKDAAEM